LVRKLRPKANLGPRTEQDEPSMVQRLLAQTALPGFSLDRRVQYSNWMLQKQSWYSKVLVWLFIAMDMYFHQSQKRLTFCFH